MLRNWRVLDLTDQRGEVGPYLLADLGADVIKVAPAATVSDAYDGNKSLLALSGETAADRAAVLELVATSDLVFDSGPSGCLESLGIDEAELVGANPVVVRVLVTPFGDDGPRAHQPATELTIGALGGSVRLQGRPDRAPVQMSVSQVWRHAGAEAAIAGLVAHRRMRSTRRPQFVDVSAQSVMTWTMLNAMEAHAVQGRDFERTGSELHLAMTVQLRQVASDGWVICVPTGRTIGPILPWLLEEGIVDPGWADVDWAMYDHRLIMGEPVEYPIEVVVGAVAELCRRHTKRELMLRGLELGTTLAPLNTEADLLAFDHLDTRAFWATIDLDGAEPAIGHDRLRAPGVFFRRNGERPDAVRGRPAVFDPSFDDRSSTLPIVAFRASGGSGAGAALPLDGLNVVDFSWIGVGPITAKCLADHGATVVRVESEGRIDGLRGQPPFRDGEPGLNRSNFFGTFNTSKKSLSVDLKSPSGLDVARRLISWADVVVESFTPGTMERLGLGYHDIVSDNPSVVMVSTNLLGSGSPVSTMAGYGYHAAAIAGFQNLVGWPDVPPDGPWLAYTDTIGPRFITSALLAALDHRDRTGEGCHVEAAQLEVALQLLAPELLQYQLDAKPLLRRGNREPGIAPQGVYPCLGDDQWLALSVVDDERWARLVGLLGEPVWACAPALATVAGREAAHDIIDGQLALWTIGHDGAELESVLAESGIAAGVVQGSRQLLADPQYEHRGFYAYCEHSEVGLVPYAGHQYRIRDHDHGPRHAAPCLGEHTFEVLTELLGMDVDDVAEIAASGALV